jgi:dTDP-4-dehydrorhamnose 3,5-epimerase
MELLETGMAHCFELRNRLFQDERGNFCKYFHADIFLNNGLNATWRELYWSESKYGVLRGLHFQTPPSDHAKLVSCLQGEVWDVVVDLRRSSPTFGRHVSRILSGKLGNAMYVPKGMAHGFLVTSEHALVCYAVETVYSPESDQGIHWNSCGISWPLRSDVAPIISSRDAEFPTISSFESPFA